MKTFLSLAATVLGIVLVVVLCIALVAGWSIGFGWILTQLIPSFTLFEASLIMMLASVVVGYAAMRLLAAMPDPNPDADSLFDIDDDEPISATRFYKTERDKTGEAWLRFQLANDIYMDLDDDPRATSMMNNSQIEELAVRLVDAIVPILKRKRKMTRQISVTKSALKQEMKRLGQRPYDDDILEVAIESVNELLYYDDELADIVRQKQWNTPVVDW